MMSRRKIFVNHLPSNFTYEQFKRLFRPIGPIKRINLVNESESKENVCKGYGFVEFHFQNDADRSIEILNDLRVQNRKLKVEHFFHDVKTAKILVRSLKRDVTEENLRKVFSFFGEIAYIKILRDYIAPKMYGVKNVTGISTGSAFVAFYCVRNAMNACRKLKGQHLFGSRRPVDVQLL